MDLNSDTTDNDTYEGEPTSLESSKSSAESDQENETAKQLLKEHLSVKER